MEPRYKVGDKVRVIDALGRLMPGVKEITEVKHTSTLPGTREPDPEPGRIIYYVLPSDTP